MSDDKELWTIARVAEHLGYAGSSAAGSARRTLSRLGVKRVRTGESEAGRLLSLYDADEVRAAAAGRPGQGSRTDQT
ncbi:MULTISPECIES: hypothetical protein [unclassified Streptomyces]|uniref:hypothetical protein n=1 Tax=unclassified Streptomyces TaxID=2593676 RepID=UPI00226EE863|nr:MULTISPECIES: hypothetical protein [unclassified Streptomyces]MCY0923445.1 hypothetical protein [Streptomyces sp. H27-G5]MCY0961879.1 hypothetical protein [Streptomyces sp. H27-H5]